MAKALRIPTNSNTESSVDVHVGPLGMRIAPASGVTPPVDEPAVPFSIATSLLVEALNIADDGSVGIVSTFVIPVTIKGSATARSQLSLQSTADAAGSVVQYILAHTGTDSVTSGAASVESRKDQQWTSTASTRDASLEFLTRENNSLSVKALITSAGFLGVARSVPDYRVDIGGAYGGDLLSADPVDPDVGRWCLWGSDGTETGSNGDLVFMSNVSGTVTKTVIS